MPIIPDSLLNVIDESTQLRLDEPPVTKAGYVKQSYHPQYSKIGCPGNAALPYKWLGGTFNKIPKWTAGLSTGFYYKNFDLNVYFYTRQKYGQLLGVLTDEAGSTRYNHLDVDFWTPA